MSKSELNKLLRCNKLSNHYYIEFTSNTTDQKKLTFNTVQNIIYSRIQDILTVIFFDKDNKNYIAKLNEVNLNQFKIFNYTDKKYI